MSEHKMEDQSWTALKKDSFSCSCSRQLPTTANSLNHCFAGITTPGKSPFGWQVHFSGGHSIRLSCGLVASPLSLTSSPLSLKNYSPPLLLTFQELKKRVAESEEAAAISSPLPRRKVAERDEPSPEQSHSHAHDKRGGKEAKSSGGSSSSVHSGGDVPRPTENDRGVSQIESGSHVDSQEADSHEESSERHIEGEPHEDKPDVVVRSIHLFPLLLNNPKTHVVS